MGMENKGREKQVITKNSKSLYDDDIWVKF